MATGSESGDTADAGAEADGEAAREPAADSLKGRSRDPKVFVLLRELSEVHLLLDNISANPSTTVAESGPIPLPAELGPDWIEKVCAISWPPDGSVDEKAEDAALLIRAKDYLNRLSRPASGSTIAFTLLVTQGGGDYKWRLKKGGILSARQSPTRSSLAQTAYPDLVSKAAGFRRWMAVISVGLLAVLVLTCVLSWYTAYGNAALAELATAQANIVDTRKRVSEAESEADAATAPAPNQTSQPAPDAEAGSAETATAATFTQYCDRPIASAAQSQLCAERWRASASVERVQRRLVSWLCWGPFADCPNDPPAATPASKIADEKASRPGTSNRVKTAVAKADQPKAASSPRPGAETLAQTAEALRLAREREDLDVAKEERAQAKKVREAEERTAKNKLLDAPSRAAALANIMGTAVLPFLYGLLGAGAAIIRSLSRKIRSSLLSPRDLHLSFQQLALGAVVGACIGLFIAAPGPGEAGESLLGPVALSASAISFVAGFGVEAVFQALEALIQRIFNIAPIATGNRGDGVAHN